MAKNARAVSPAAAPLILTKPSKAAGGKKKEKLSITGFEKTAAQMRARQEQIDSLVAEQDSDKAKVIEVCKKERRDAEVAGDFFSTCLLESDDGKPVQVAFQNKFSKVDVAHEDALRSAMNGQYETLFRRGVEISVKDGVTLDKLQKALGDRFDALAALVDLSEFLVLDRDFMSKRAALRPALDAATNATIDQITDQTQYKPSIRTK